MTHTDYLMVDQLGEILAQIKRLEDQANMIKAELKANGTGQYAGDTFSATVYESKGRTTIDWQTIAEKFNPSRQLVAAHTSVGQPVVSVKVSKI
jgi:hypothetical protein